VYHLSFCFIYFLIKLKGQPSIVCGFLKVAPKPNSLSTTDLTHYDLPSNCIFTFLSQYIMQAFVLEEDL